MRTKVFLISLIVSLVCIGCDRWTDTIGYDVSYENATEHTIDITTVLSIYSITRNNQLLPGGHYVERGASIEGEDGASLKRQLEHLIPQKVILTYDNKYRVSFTRDTENDYLCKVEDYTIVTIHELLKSCHYVFTEADYEYAKTYGEEVSEDNM